MVIENIELLAGGNDFTVCEEVSNERDCRDPWDYCRVCQEA
jgi:hypothetical protein